MKRWFLVLALLLVALTRYGTRKTTDASDARAPFADGSAETVIRTLAEEGDAKYQYDLGSRIYYGQGFPQDYTKAAEWFRKAAIQGHPEAQTFLAIMQREGRGLPINVVEAGEWLRKAADVGEPRAQATLGVAIFIGETPPKDTLEAYKWETLAVARATEDELKKFALNSHQRMTSLMTAPEIAEGEARARRWSETWAAREDLVREKALRAFCDRRDTCPIMVESAAPSKTLLDRLRDQPKFTAFAEVRGPNGQLDTRGVIDVEKIQWRGVDKALIRIGTWAGPLNAYAATFLVERSAGSGWSASIVRGSEMMS